MIELNLTLAIRRLRSKESEKLQNESVSDRISALTGNLAESQRLIDELATEVQLRSEALERLTAEAEEKRNLAALHADEAAAVDALVSRRMQESVDRLERGSRRQQWSFLFLGSVLVAVPIGVIGNFVFEWLK
ncbi:hypothetical protein OU415_02420 [Saccharopolyspora sp. WRP15-2]|uniref:Uncharacterized protein n=1 Tax=Saccharopolyspora oryzae TaxID=2997343 RepID=A0ABT4UT84_9PSEU|nr:hypothetical protein [Saccharopolyspora oryzae]